MQPLDCEIEAPMKPAAAILKTARRSIVAIVLRSCRAIAISVHRPWGERESAGVIGMICSRNRWDCSQKFGGWLFGNRKCSTL